MKGFGKWIWVNSLCDTDTYGEFYTEINARENCTVKISCDGDYALFVNGNFAASNQYGDFEHYKSYDTVDISPFLKNGKGCVGIVVWHFGKSTQRYKKYSAGLLFEIYENSHLILASDENILSRKSKAYVSGLKKEISSQLGFSYQYDSTKEDGWLFGKGEDFEKSVIVNKVCSLVSRPNKRLQLLNPVYGTEIGKGVYDLGREYVGLLTLTVCANEPAKINIAYGEMLENGHVKRKIGARDFSIDYVAREGKSTHTSYMLRFACRYLEICPVENVKIEKIGIIPQTYPVIEKQVDFLNSQDRKIYDICVNTLKLCMMEHYVDCPWREQCLYAFDSRNQMLCGYYAFEGGNFEYVKSNLVLMSKDKRDDGLMSICYPCGIDLTIPSFSLHYVTSVLEYIVHSGDRDIFKIVSPKLTEIINTFLSNRENGLVCTFEGKNHWNFYDWSDHLEGSLGGSESKKPDALINMLTIMALDSYEKICIFCGEEFIYEGIANSLRTLTKSRFFDTENGVVLMNDKIKPLSLVNSLAVLSGVVNNSEAKVICSKLANGELSPSSLSTRCFMYDALIKTDERKYKSFILNDIRKTYAPMIETGTVWETVIGSTDFDNAGSLCHGWSGMPIYYYNKLLNKEI